MTGIRIDRRADPVATERILRSLPQWFGIEDALNHYVQTASIHDSFLAVDAEEVVGVALVNRHFPQSAELSLIAVHADFRGRGAGSALVDAVANTLRAEAVSLLQVHTVGPSFEDAGYRETRAFYESCGFLPLQEFDGLEWDGPTLISVKVIG